MSKMAWAVGLLEAKQIAFEILHHKTTFTAADEAATLYVAAAQALNTVVLDTNLGHVIAATPASSRLDMTQLQEVVADKHAHLAREVEMERDFPDFEPGSMPPVPSLAKVPLFVDPGVIQQSAVVFSVDHGESVRVKTVDLFGGGYVTVTPLVRHVPKSVATIR